MEYFYLVMILVILSMWLHFDKIPYSINKNIHNKPTFYKMIIMMVIFLLTPLDGEVNPDLNTLIEDSRYIVYPQNIELENNIWYNEDNNEPYTGKIFIYQRKNVNYRVATCMISGGMRNGMFTQYYDEKDRLPAISGIYVDNKKEGVWSWVYPDSALIIKTWKGSNLFKITSIDYRSDIQHGSIIIQKSKRINYDFDQRLYVPRENIYLQGEYINGVKSGEWLYNDYDKDVTNMVFYWSRKIHYDNGILIDEECREPWGIEVACEEYYAKYVSPADEQTGDSNENYQDITEKKVHDMVTLIDDGGERVNLNISKFISHIEEYHDSEVSVHRTGRYSFTIDDDFRLMLQKITAR
tara:strand:+ start:1563 stop:2621 length:1059 start_codon:yes stop_codon:yes gene_type:complete